MNPIADILLEPCTLQGGLKLNNKIAMAPMTRSKATEDLLPTEAMLAYYERRAQAGLIITEGTLFRPDGQGYPRVPGIMTDAQIAAWAKITAAVHKQDGKIFLQLWHVGRVTHPCYLGGKDPIAPSAVALEGSLPRQRELQYGMPRPLATKEVSEVAMDYARGGENALRAGFDGIEIHGANGYLVDQFLHHHTNRREDRYGGSPQNMARFALEVVDRCVEKLGSPRVGLRLSPGAYLNMAADPRDTDVFRYLLGELASRNLAYLHTGIFDDSMLFDYLGGQAGAFLRANYRGLLMGNGSYLPDAAAAGISQGKFDLISIGRPFLSNPDLVDRIARGEVLIPYQPEMLRELI